MRCRRNGGVIDAVVLVGWANAASRIKMAG